MRIVVFSDSHKNYLVLQSIVSSQPEAELFIHLGDGEQEFQQLKEAFPHKRMLGVRGNCDWGSDGRDSDKIICEEKCIFFTHGHLYGVKAGLDRIEEEARFMNVDILLFGHTHFAYSTFKKGLFIMNPGSVTSPAEGRPSYGVIDITRGGIFMNIVHLNQGRFW